MNSEAHLDFLKVYSRLFENNALKPFGLLSPDLHNRACERKTYLSPFHKNSRGMSLEGGMKNYYAVQRELSYFVVDHKSSLKEVDEYDVVSEAVEELGDLFELCKADYKNRTGEGFQDLLIREGVHNGLPRGYCSYDIFRGLQEEGRLPPSEWIPFIVYIGMGCYDMPATYFDNFGHLTSLESLELKHFGEFVPSFEPLSKLSKLRYLSLEYCTTIDFRPLAKLKNLETLELINFPHLLDISPIGEIESLKTVFFFDTTVEDYSPLKKLPNLSHLSVTNADEISLEIQKEIGMSLV